MGRRGEMIRGVNECARINEWGRAFDIRDHSLTVMHQMGRRGEMIRVIVHQAWQVGR